MKYLNYLLIFLLAVAIGWVLQEYDAGAQDVPVYKVPIIEFNAAPPDHLWTKSKDPSRLVPENHNSPVPIDSARFDHYVPHYKDWKGMEQSRSDKTPTTPLLAGTLATDRADLVSQAVAITTRERNRDRIMRTARTWGIYPDDETISMYAESLLAYTLSDRL